MFYDIHTNLNLNNEEYAAKKICRHTVSYFFQQLTLLLSTFVVQNFSYIITISTIYSLKICMRKGRIRIKNKLKRLRLVTFEVSQPWLRALQLRMRANTQPRDNSLTVVNCRYVLGRFVRFFLLLKIRRKT